MSGDDVPRRSHRATCEDYDEDEFGDGGEDHRRSANVAAKRSKPDLHPKASYERRRNNGTDSGYASQAGTGGSGSPNRREKRLADLKIDTGFQERERQPYHYSAAKTEARAPPSRPPADSAAPKSPETRKHYIHKEGDCWICDKYGKHIDPPKVNSVAISPTTARRPSATDDYMTAQTSQVQPRMRRTSSNRGPRPVSMYANIAPGVLYETKTLPSTFTHESPSYPTTSWHPPPTPVTVQYAQLTPVTYAQYPVSTAPQVMTPVETQRSYFHALPPPKNRPAEPNRRASMYGQSDRPVVQQGNLAPARSREEKDRSYDYRTPLQSRRSSQERDLDRRAMPPPPLPPLPPPPQQPEQVILARRPSVKRAATATSTPASHRHSQSYDIDRDEFRRLEAIREKKTEASLPPTSYRGPAAANPERPPNRKSGSYDQPRHSFEVAARTPSASDSGTRRMTQPSIERYEAEAEAYQRRRGSSGTRDLRSHHLTAEALRKVPKSRAPDSRSETNSSQKSRNSSSKGSSGGKTGQSNSEIMMRINGIAVGIPADSAQRITIQSKGVNISVGGKGRGSDKEYPSSRDGRAPSVASRTSKTSSNREKEKRIDMDDGRRGVRDGEAQTLDRAGRTSQSLSRYSSRNEEEQIGYGA